ncbi:hypothetical protein FBQ97_04155 [Acidobacteria bacterium ACD]|nr:MAG: hypothetical protein EDX89_07085 [Acidobacteriota bacterium]MCE7957160.1 hypothetical protein [Acidobacteria bacterium ACB2]MDL1948990.1 hypothetical protein [Acidobacteria bacterium ACD]
MKAAVRTTFLALLATLIPGVPAHADITVYQSTCCGTAPAGGATGATSTALATWLGGGYATDNCDPNPTRLANQVGNVDIDDATYCFPSGSTAVTFRFRDAAGNIGSATGNVTVRMYGDLDLTGAVDPADMVVLQSYFNFAVSPEVPPFGAPAAMADLTHDTIVDPADMVQLQAYFNFAVSCLAP